MSLQNLNIAVVGATGAVGREVLVLLRDREVTAERVRGFASPRSAGTRVPFGDSSLTIQPAEASSFKGVDLAIFAASSRVSRDLAPHASAAGAVVIDNSSAFRMRPGVPLIIPEINGALVSRSFPRTGIIANPNCSTIILLIAIEPLRRAIGVREIVVSTYQAVSGAGQAGIDALNSEIAGSRDTGPFTEPCFLNVFSHNAPVDSETGLNGEEQKIIDESRKILNDPSLAITPTCVRVPVIRAHSESILVRLARPASEAEVRRAYWEARGTGVRVQDDRAGNRFPTPLKASGQDDVIVGRIRPDPARPRDAQGRTDSWCLWACGDQLRKGAATNAVQIAELVASASVPQYTDSGK